MEAKSVELSGGEWCVCTTIHVSVAIHADVTDSTVLADDELRIRFTCVLHGAMWGRAGGCNMAGAGNFLKMDRCTPTRADRFCVSTTLFSFSFHFS